MSDPGELALAAEKPLRVDIVVNNYNYGRFVADAIDSALEQSYPHVRVIAVDDGSNDDSVEVIAGYGDRVFTVAKENGGQGSAFNAGFVAGDGDIVIFLDADDLLDPLIAARVADAFTATPEAAKVQWQLELADIDGRPTGVIKPGLHLPLPEGDMRRAELAFSFDIAWTATSGNAYPRWALRELLPMPEPDYRIAADAYLQHLPALLGPVVSINDVGALRRVHGANAHEQATHEALDVARVRTSIRAARVTSAHLQLLAVRLGYDRGERPPLSVSYSAQRLISLRLEPAEHPVAGDRRLPLVLGGLRAAAGRFDVKPPLRVMFALWFLAVAVAPRAVVRTLAEWLLFPERRGAVNGLLSALHRGYGRIGQR